MVNSEKHLFIAQEQPDQLINQVFTAAIDLGRTNRDFRGNPIAQEWAQYVLNAAYEGTLRTAFVQGKKRVFLTLVGGGVFGNDLDWICDAINRMSYFIERSGLEVTLVWWGNGLNANVAQRERFGALVNYSGGSYMQFRDDGVYRLAQ